MRDDPGIIVGSRLMTHELKLLASSSRSRIEERRRAPLSVHYEAGYCLLFLTSSAKREQAAFQPTPLSSFFYYSGRTMETQSAFPDRRPLLIQFSTTPIHINITNPSIFHLNTRYNVVHFYTLGCTRVMAL